MRTSLLVAAAAVSLASQAFGQQEVDAARAPIEQFFPARGTSAPRNTKVWLETSFAPSDFELRDSAGRPVATQAVSIPVAGNFSTLVVLTPTQELAPGSYSVARTGAELTAFTVTNEVDTTAPAALQVTATSDSFAPVAFQPRSRGGTSTTLTFDVAPELALVVNKDQSWLPSTALTTVPPAVRSAFVADLPVGKQELRVFHFDLAGNVTTTDVVVDVPPLRGCSVAAGWPLALLALALLRRR
jgi:hypothetical protein